jgi:hypothetical protein
MRHIFVVLMPRHTVLAFSCITDENHDKFDTIPGTSADTGSGYHPTTNQERYHYTSFPATRQRRKARIKRDCEYITNGFQPEPEPMVR